MKSGIIGQPRSGKSTVFEALSGNVASGVHKGEPRIGSVRVPDPRIDALSAMFKPLKTIYAQVEYLLPGLAAQKHESSGESGLWTQVRPADALIHVVRNFGGYGFEDPTPEADFQALNEELVFSDLVVADKRLERLEQDKKRGKKPDPEEVDLLESCRQSLEAGQPLRRSPELAEAPRLRGFTFLSAKPTLVLFNNADEDDELPQGMSLTSTEDCMVIRGRLEQELAQMSPEEAEEFLAEFGIAASARDRVVRRSYELLGLISFFTVGSDEVRAWTVPRGTPAIDAADTIHSDMKKGFIRAEVVSYDDLTAAGSYPEARKRGTVRLEGKTYEVQDGDILEIRFNV